MAKYLPLPNGASLKVPDSMSYMEAMSLARERFPEAFAEPEVETPKKKGLGAALGKGFESALSSAAAGVKGIFAPEEAAKEAAVRGEAIGKKYEEQVGLEPVKKAYEERGLLSAAGEVARQVPLALAEQATNIGATVGGGGVGRILGGIAGAPLGPAGVLAGQTIGGIAGAVLPSFLQQAGGNIQRQAEEARVRGETPEISRAAAYGAAVPQAALDVASTFIPLGRTVAGKVLGPGVEKMLKKGLDEGAEKLAKESLKKLLVKGTAVGALAEVPTEIAQQMLERAQAGLSLTSEDALREYGETAYQTSLLAPIGAAGRYVERGAARDIVAQRQAEQQRLAAEQAEAAKNAPDALRALDAQYQQLLAQKTELDAAVVKPAKGATPEEKKAYQEAKQARDLFVQEQFLPVQQEYNQRKDAIAALKAAEAPPAPEAEKVSPDVQRLMVEQDDLRKQMDALTAQMREQPDAFEALDAQRQQLQRRLDARAALIEEKGGVAIPTVEFEQNVAAKVTELNGKIESLKKAYPEAIDAQDYDKARKISTDLKQAQEQLARFTEDAAKRMRALQEKQAGLEQRGQTQELFAEMPEQPEEKGITYKTPSGEPIEVGAARPEEALSFEAKPAEAPAGLTKVQQAEEALRTAAKERKDPATLQNLYRKLQEARAEEARGEPTPPAAAAAVSLLREATRPATIAEGRRAGDRTTSPRRIEELQAELQDVLPKDARTEDLFGSINVLRTGLQNEDPKAIQQALAAIESRKRAELSKTREEQDTEKAQLIKALNERLGLTGEKVTRTATPEQYDSVMAQIEALRNSVEKPQRNAKRSILQELEDLAAEHALISNALETGMAYKVTMGDKVAQLNAALGKGEAAPAQRPMTRNERSGAKKRLIGITNRFNMLVDTKVAPVRKQIEDLYKSLYTREKVEAPATERAKREAELDRRARAAQPMSRAARTAARLSKGDVRKEAEASLEMRQLALDLGRAEGEYKTFAQETKRRYDALKARYGANDPRVIEFQDKAKLATTERAISLGRQTPEYKAVLAEQIEITQAALKETKFSKQTVPTKRTPQVTRKVTQAPRRLLTESPESRAETTEEFKREQERFGRFGEKPNKDFDDDVSTALRKREDTEETRVDAAEASKLVEQVKADLPSNVKFIYAPTVRDVPVRLLNQMVREKADPTQVQGAVFSDGTVLVIGENHANLKDLEATIAHELIGHYGIDTIVGIKQLQTFANNTDVLKLAEEVGGADLRAEAQAAMDSMKDIGRDEATQRLQALREIIAHTEEARVTEAFREKAGRWIKELIGMVRAGLKRMGFMNTAKLSTSDIFYMLRESRKAFANKRIGAYRSADGQIAFKQRRHDVTLARSFVAKEPRIYDRLLGNFMGLSGRVQYVDKDAALSEAFKRGLAKGQITSLEASNAEFALRFGQKVTQYASQFLSHGAVKRVPDPRGPKGAYIYESKPGANMVEVAAALNKGGFSNDTQAEAILTAFVAGERAKVVGWNKLNFDDPAEMQRQYNEVVAYLDANPKAKDAVKEAARIYKEFNDGQIDFLVQMGEMTPAKAAELKSRPYIPYYRIDGDGLFLFVEKERPIRIGNVKDQPELKALVGGNTQIMPIFTSAVQNAFILTRMGLRNQMMKESAFTLQKLGIVSKMGPGKGPDNSSTVRFKVKGVPHFAVIDQDQFGIPAELIVKGMEGIKTATPAIIEVMGLPADVLRKFVTRMPVYAIRQIIRDPLNAWLTTGTDTVPVLSSFVELGKMMVGRSEAERRLMATGAISSNVFTGDQRDMSRMLRDIQAGKLGWDKLMAKADAFAIQGDAATRAVIYNDSLAKGMTEQQALLRTMESMNFDRRGLSPSMRALSIMIPFFNAQIQGLDVLYRAFTGQMPYSEQLKIRQKLWSRGLLLAVGTLAYAAMMEDDEAYKRAKPEERLANWFVYVPGFDEPVRVPIPFELGYLFKALPEALYHSAKGDVENKQALEGMARLITQTVPFALPQAVKPLTEVILGKSFYSGDIESSREQSLLATERYRDTTTGLARMIGSVTGMVGLSPIKIDYLIRGYTGGLGIAITQLANPLVNVVLPKEEVPEPTTKLSKTPLIGGLFQPVEGRGTLDAAYDRMKQIKEVDTTFKQMVKDGRGADARALAQNYSTEMALVATSGQVYKQLGDLAALERQVKKSPNLSTEQKDERLKALDAQKERVARMYLDVSERMAARQQ